MSHHQPPRPPKPPQWVGDGTTRRNVADMTDRAVAILALDTALRQENQESTYAQGAHLKAHADLENRLAALEKGRGHAAIPPPAEEIHVSVAPPARDSESPRDSSHEFDEQMLAAARTLYERAKDPKDRLDSIRARQIAKEVVEATKIADDAKAFKIWKSRAAKIAFEIAKILVPSAVSFGAGTAAVQAQHPTPAPTVTSSPGAPDGGR